MKGLAIAVAVGACVCGIGAVATADDAAVVAHTRRAPPRYTASVALPSLAAHGLAVELERDLPAQHLAIVGGLAVRSGAGGDYDSRTIAAGLEVRYWLRRRAVWTRRPNGAAIGWYAAARLDLGRTIVTDSAGDDLGSQDSLGFAALAGYRFAPWRGLEVRPYGGIAVRRERDVSGRMEPWTRPSLSMGLAVGWSF